MVFSSCSYNYFIEDEKKNKQVQKQKPYVSNNTSYYPREEVVFQGDFNSMISPSDIKNISSVPTTSIKNKTVSKRYSRDEMLKPLSMTKKLLDKESFEIKKFNYSSNLSSNVLESESDLTEEYFSAYGSTCKKTIMANYPRLVCKKSNGDEYIVNDLTY